MGWTGRWTQCKKMVQKVYAARIIHYKKTDRAVEWLGKK